ncbi:MAG: oxidoreductase [Rhodospirillales bacterium]|nr:oxidoreductase [Rhodospirillales bacterium]
MADTFRALMLRRGEDGKTVTSEMEDVAVGDLPDGEVTVAVEYSNLNYKDGLILQGLGGLVRNYPHIGGIDYAGTVEASDDPAIKPGDRVILTGWRVGENRWGGYGARATARSGWCVKVPNGLDTRRAMAIGTAGFTAMLSVMALEDHGLTPDAEGEVVVTGAAGGVGSVAVSILANLGYRVAASTGREAEHAYLTDLGAASIVPRAELEEDVKGPLSSERWAGAIDNVCGPVLSNVMRAMRTHAAVAAVGLAGGAKFDGNIIPFLLRGVSLLGIDSVLCPIDRRIEAWERLASQLPLDKLDALTTVAPLEKAPELAGDILAGRVRGRTVLEIGG